MFSSEVTAHQPGIQLVASERIIVAIVAGLFGSMMLYAVAFANSDMLHNAAHDTRHSITAPCH